MVMTDPLMCTIQQISAQVGPVTGRGLAGNLRQHYPALVLHGLVGLLVIANTLNIGADLGAMAAAVRLLIGGPSIVYLAFFAIVSGCLQVFSGYDPYVRFLKLPTLSPFASLATP